MMIEIARNLGDNLNREVWKFRSDGGIGTNSLILDYYCAHEHRQTTRHKWRWKETAWIGGASAPRFNNGEQPSSIPQWVIEEALSQMRINVHFGFLNHKYKYGTFNLNGERLDN